MLKFDKSNPASVKQWKSASLVAAQNAFGHVYIIMGKDENENGAKIYHMVEHTALANNKHVTHFSFIDPKSCENLGTYTKSEVYPD